MAGSSGSGEGGVRKTSVQETGRGTLFANEAIMKFCICIHVFYLSTWETIKKHLKLFSKQIDLYITCPKNIYIDLQDDVDLQSFNKNIDIVDNCGMDVLPFLYVCHKYKLNRYKVVLKLHTKNDKNNYCKIYGETLYECLLKNDTLCANIINLFEKDANVGLAGPMSFCRSSEYFTFANMEKIHSICAVLNLPMPDYNYPFICGTMFWICGEVLTIFIENYSALESMFRSDNDFKTGIDGKYPHAFERFFGMLICILNKKFICYENINSETDDLCFSTLSSEIISTCSIFNNSSSAYIRSKFQANDAVKILKQSDLFDENYYISNKVLFPNIDPALHYAIYGRVFKFDPSPNFSTVFYLLKNGDIFSAGICPLYHFIKYGQAEGRIGNPQLQDWINLAVKLKLFDPGWYENKYKDVAYSGSTAIENYCCIGSLLKRSTSINFCPQKIPVCSEQSISSDNDNYLTYFLKHYYLDEMLFLDHLERNSLGNNFELVRTLSTKMLNKFGKTKSVAEALATACIYLKNFNDARKLWSNLWEFRSSDKYMSRGRSSIVKFDRDVHQASFPQIKVNHPKKINEFEQKVCIYTSLYGEYDKLAPILDPVPGVDYICFSDRERQVSGWKIVIIDQSLANNNLNAKFFKVLPHRCLPTYAYSLFVDANTLFLGRVDLLLSLCIENGKFIAWEHPVRTDLYLESAAIIGFKKHEPIKIVNQIEAYSHEGLPHQTGMIEASFLWRKHNDPNVIDFMERWWDHILLYSTRDQLSLGFLLWKYRFEITTLPKSLGTSRNNIFFVKNPHSNNSNLNNHDFVTSNYPAFKWKNADIMILYNDRSVNVGSTFMRGEQLCNLLRENNHQHKRIYYSNCDQVKNKILVLTKGYLKFATNENLKFLKKNNNIIIADFIDDKPNQDLITDVHVLMASSLKAYAFYLANFKTKESFYVTHHIDPRLKVFKFNKTIFSNIAICYLGELVNTIVSESIKKYVNFIHVKTSKLSSSWIDSIYKFNFHYALRKKRGIDGFKPFLKGFTAAFCFSNILVQRDESDASYYLGPDYPYYFDGELNERAILSKINDVISSYSSPEWHYGLDIMSDVRRRTSDEFVANEFFKMIDKITC